MKKQRTFLPKVALRGMALGLAMWTAATPAGAQQEAAELRAAKAEAAATPDSATDDAAAAHRKAERERIQRERNAVQAQRHAQEAACYRRFAVEDCLRGVRASSRDAASCTMPFLS